MTTEAEAAEVAAPEVVATPPAEAGFSSQEQETATPEVPARDFEAEARAEGWVPETEWKGDPKKRPVRFLSAEEFVERGETIKAFADKRLKKTEIDLEKKVEERVSRMQRMYERNMKLVKDQHARELSDARQAMRVAASRGDLNAYDAYSKEVDRLVEATPTDDPEPIPAKPEAKGNEAVEAQFAKDNPWYGTDEVLTNYAVGVSNRIARPDMSMEDNLAKTLAEVKKAFPEKFGAKGANGHASVDGGSDFAGTPRTDPMVAKLGKAELAQADKDIEAGLYRDRKAWAKAYFS